MKLNDSTLFTNKAFINDKWITSNSNFEVTNPSKQEVIGNVSDMGAKETNQAILAASDAFKQWKKLSAGKRSKYLLKWHNLILENIDDLARILTIEQGKPLAESKGEILYGASFIKWFAEEGRRVYGETIPGNTENARIFTIKQPIGVVGAITPWNFPNAMITRKIAPALAVGCTVVVKPSELTPYSALALGVLAQRAGFPKGVINIVTTTKASEVGIELCENPIVKKISFTGSTKTGKILLAQSANTVKKLSLELGGNAPFIIFKDANIDKAIQGAIASKYRNAGQTCISTNRFFVEKEILQEFTEKYTNTVKKLKVGNGLEDNVKIGTLINKNAVEKVNNLVTEAIKDGAKITLGNLHEDDNLFYNPIILSNVNQSMRISHEEIFGPVSSITSFESEEEVISLANDTPFGLASYFYGTNINQIWRVAEALEYGMVGVNTGSISTTLAPFGGIKESGFGKEGSKYGIEDYVITKYINISIED